MIVPRIEHELLLIGSCVVALYRVSKTARFLLPWIVALSCVIISATFGCIRYYFEQRELDASTWIFMHKTSVQITSPIIIISFLFAALSAIRIKVSFHHFSPPLRLPFS